MAASATPTSNSSSASASASASATPTTTHHPRDLSSQSNPHEIRVTHLDWDVVVDFDDQLLRCDATYSIENLVDTPVKTTLDLDTAYLDIESVTDQDGNELKYTLHSQSTTKSHLGSKLSIDVSGDVVAITKIRIKYSTTDKCTAIQWLPPAQTSGKKLPYMFTQCQAIHARSIVPCQDCPGVKMTYKAVVTVPSWSTCLMSAVMLPEQEEVMSENDADYRKFKFRQSVPVSSYLLAMVVGELSKRDVSDRCAVWSEPGVVDAAYYEFAQTEDFLRSAETIAGVPYVWGRYDLLCLPPSFPYGGMENPCLTFVTPVRSRSCARHIC